MFLSSIFLFPHSDSVFLPRFPARPVQHWNWLLQLRLESYSFDRIETKNLQIADDVGRELLHRSDWQFRFGSFCHLIN